MHERVNQIPANIYLFKVKLVQTQETLEKGVAYVQIKQ